MTEERMSKQAKIDWGNVPSWIATMVSVITLVTGLGSGKVLSDIHNEGIIQALRDSLEPLEKEKERLGTEIANLETDISKAHEEKKKLTAELTQAKEELEKPVVIDLSGIKPTELIINRQLQPRGLSAVEMTLDKVLIEQGVGMIMVFSVWNKYEGSVNSQAANHSRLIDNLGRDYGLLESTGRQKINGGTKAELKIRFPIPQSGATQLTVKLAEHYRKGVFNLSPFSITIPASIQPETTE